MATVKNKIDNKIQVKANRDEAVTHKRCLVPGCGRLAKVRGCCRQCRDSQRYFQRTAGVLEEQLMNAGVLLPKDPGGRHWRSPVYRHLKEKGWLDQ